MSPLDEDFEENREDSARDADGEAVGAEQQPNIVVGPLTDDELKVGGMVRTVAFIRTNKSKDALRQAKRRAKQKAANLCQMNIEVPDNDRARATMRSAAIAIQDEASHQAFEAILADEGLRPVVVKVAAQPALREIIKLSESSDLAETLDAAKLVFGHPDIVALIKRVTATNRTREVVDAALTNPEFVVLGRSVATGHSICVRIARVLLRIHQRQVRDRPKRTDHL